MGTPTADIAQIMLHVQYNGQIGDVLQQKEYLEVFPTYRTKFHEEHLSC